MPTEYQRGCRQGMPSQPRIRKFWAYKLLALGKIGDVEDVLEPVVDGWGPATAAEVHAHRVLYPDVDIPDHDDPIRAESVLKTWQCFCCGQPGSLDRAHIRPLALGGSNSVENLHLLCRSCHIESENFQGEGYWRWFLSKPFLGSMHPDHYTHLWQAIGARDIHHAAEIATIRFGTDFYKLREGVRTMPREAYGQN